MGKQWRCAVIGAGTVGHTHVKVLSQLENTKLVAVCDSSVAKAQAAMERHGVKDIPIYDNPAELFAKQKLDVVNIATPSGHHQEATNLAFKHGVNVICEKPLEIQLGRIDQMIADSQRLGLKLAYISQNRWQEANRALKDAVAEGRFGRIAYAACYTPWYRPDDYYEKTPWRGTWALDGGGAIMNQSIHAIDLLQWIVGPVARVSAFGASRIHPKIETEDTLSAAICFEHGAFGSIMGSTAMFPGSAVRIEIGGENGTAVAEAGLKTFKFRDEQPADKELQDRINASSPGQARGAGAASDIGLDLHARNITAILSAWDQGAEPETNAQEARKSVAIVTALYESVRAGGAPIDVNRGR